MQNIINIFHTYLTFCASVFWCRWDNAILNWISFYVLCYGLVYMGREYQVLFGSSEVWDIALLALVVTVTTAFVSMKYKKNVANIELLHQNKDDGFDT